MAIATLSIDLEARLANLQAGLDRAGYLAEQQASRIDRAFTGLRNTAASLGGVIAGAFAVEGMAAFVRHTIDGLDALNDLADATGASIRNISALEDVAARTGTSFESVGTALVKFNSALKETDPNGPMARALAQIGLNAAELRKIDPVDALKRTADALAGFADDGDKARLVQELFGKSIREVAPLLKDLADAQEINGTVTNEAARQAEIFNQQLFALRKNSEDSARAIASKLLPAVNDFIVTARQGGFAKALGLDELPGKISMVSTAYQGLWAAIKAADAMAAARIAPGWDLPRQRLAEATEQAKALARSFDEANRSRLKLTDGSAGGGRGFVNPDAVRASVGPLLPAAEKAKAAKEVTDYAMEIRQAVAKMVSDSDVARLGQLNAELEELAKLAAAGLDPAIVADVQQRLQGMIAKIQPPTTAQEDFRRSELGGGASPQELKDYADKLERINHLLAATPTEKQERLQQDITLLAAEFEAGRVSAEKYTEAVQALVGTLPEDLAKTNDIAKELGMTFASAAEDAIVKWRGFGALIDGLATDVQRILARKLITEPLAQSITDWIKPSGSSGGGFDLFAMAGKAWGSFAGLFADGGYIPPGQWGIAGEQGPERIYGGRTGVTVQSSGAGGGGAVSVVNHFHLSGPVDRRTQAQIAADTSRSVQRAAARNN